MPVEVTPIAQQSNSEKDISCNEKYPGTTYRASDQMCVCPTNSPLSWNNKTHCATNHEIYTQSKINYSQPISIVTANSTVTESSPSTREDVKIKIQDRKCKKQNSESYYDSDSKKCINPNDKINEIKRQAEIAHEEKIKNNANLIILDITPTTLDWKFYQWENAYASLKVQNIGRQTIAKSTQMHITCYIDGKFMINTGMPIDNQLSPGDVTEFPIIEIDKSLLLTEWIKKISCVIDSNNEIIESNEKDNELTKSFDVISKIKNTKITKNDLIINSITLSSEYPADQNYTYISIYTTNIWLETAIVDARKIYLICQENDKTVWWVGVWTSKQATNDGWYTYVAPRETLIYSMAIPRTNSTRNLTCIVDYNQVVSEQQENNNIMTFMYYDWN